jgi:kynurenine formamidase
MRFPIRWMYLSLWLALFIVLVASCQREPSVEPITSHQIDYTTIVDLSHIVRQDMPVKPGAQAPILRSSSPDGELDVVSISMRTGTRLHMHGSDRNASVEHASVAELLVPALMIDLRDLVKDQADFRITAELLRSWEADHQPIPSGALLLCATGWDIRWSTPGAYMNVDGAGQIQAPGLDASAIALLQERGVVGVGIDTPQLIADHSTLSADNEWIVLEDLTNLEQLPASGVTLLIAPIRFQASQASPARVFAFVP